MTRSGEPRTFASNCYALNRLTRKEYPDAGGVDYTYDNTGRLVAVEDATRLDLNSMFAYYSP